jgi:hypothetical protein
MIEKTVFRPLIFAYLIFDEKDEEKHQPFHLILSGVWLLLLFECMVFFRLLSNMYFGKKFLSCSLTYIILFYSMHLNGFVRGQRWLSIKEIGGNSKDQVFFHSVYCTEYFWSRALQWEKEKKKEKCHLLSYFILDIDRFNNIEENINYN